MSLSRRLFIEAGLTAGLVAALAGAGSAEERAALGFTNSKGWSPFPWPFPPDAWPPGRAWSGYDHDVYVQMKSGLCGDCKTGVITDEAVDRAVDIDRLDPRFEPVGPGSRIRITDLFGRTRKSIVTSATTASCATPRASWFPTNATSSSPSSTATSPIH